jgi:hypothetical protein
MLETIMKKKIHRNFSMKLFFRIQEKKKQTKIKVKFNKKERKKTLQQTFLKNTKDRSPYSKNMEDKIILHRKIQVYHLCYSCIVF